MAPGPDVLTSCGYPRLLRLGAEYVAGIGGPCRPIGEWTNASEYRAQDLELLRGLRDGGVVCGGSTTEPPTTLPTSMATVLLASKLLPIVLIIATLV